MRELSVGMWVRVVTDEPRIGGRTGIIVSIDPVESVEWGVDAFIDVLLEGDTNPTRSFLYHELEIVLLPLFVEARQTRE